MRNDYFRYYKPRILLPLLVFLGVVFHLGNHYLSSHWGVSGSIVGITTVLLALIDKWLWKYPPFSYLFWSTDLSGVYHGEILYTNPATGNEESKHVEISIDQTGSSIQLRAAVGSPGLEDTSNSKSIQTELVKDDFGNYELIYNYQNNGNSRLKHGGYYGTNILAVHGTGSEDRVLEGVYYTNREPIQTKGMVKVKFKNQ